MSTEGSQPAEASHRPVRVRANLTTTSKGLPSIDVTVDGQDSGYLWADLKTLLDVVVTDMLRTYPPETPLGGG